MRLNASFTQKGKLMIDIFTLDTSDLCREIEVCGTRYGKNPYIICSSATLKLITSICGQDYTTGYEDTQRLHVFRGCKVLIDDSIKLGQVDVR